MARKMPGTRSELIHCDNCDEEYSATYKRCPFCGERPDKSAYTQTFRAQPTGRIQDSGRINDTGRTRSRTRVAAQEDDGYLFDGGDVFDDDDYDEDSRVKGGKRLAEEAHGFSGARLAGIVFSIVLIVAALCIVATVIMPLIRKGSVTTPDNTPGSSATVQPSETIQPSETPATTASPDVSTDPDVSSSPDVMTPTATATAMTLNREDFTMAAPGETFQLEVTLSPVGASGTPVWSSSDPGVATVDENGLITAVGKGSTTITATLDNGVSVTCIARCKSGAASAATGGNSGSGTDTSAGTSGTMTLSREDFTTAVGDPAYTIQVTGASGAVSWSTSNSSVATVDANGKVTAVSSGKCTITASSGGQSAECVVRVK